MSDKFNEEEIKPFDAILAEDMSIVLHEACCDCCPHDLAIKFAQMAEEFYMEYFTSAEKSNR